MPAKSIAITIPEPDDDGTCGATCPLLAIRVVNNRFTKVGCYYFWHREDVRPGPGCPQCVVNPYK